MIKDKVLNILQKMFPDREHFSSHEIQVATSVYLAMTSKGEKAQELPTRFVEVGELFKVKGKRYRCVLRSKIGAASDACRGCAFVGGTCPPFLQCSSFDRKDKKNVWFEEVIW